LGKRNLILTFENDVWLLGLQLVFVATSWLVSRSVVGERDF